MPELQLALNCTGHEIGHINQVGDVWIACCAGRRVQRLSEAEAEAWVEERVRGDTTEDPALDLAVARPVHRLRYGRADHRLRYSGAATPLSVLGQKDPEVLRVQ